MDTSGQRKAQSVLQKETTWLFAAPVTDLVLTKEVGYEFTVDQVTFIEINSFRRKRKRFGLPHRVSELEAQRSPMFSHFINEKTKTLATLRRTGGGEECEQEFLRLVREELAILAASQLGWHNRHRAAAPRLAFKRPWHTLSYLLCDVAGPTWSQPNIALPPYLPLHLNGRWDKFHRDAFFAQLLRIVTGKVKVDVAWQRALKTAAVLTGQSQSSPDLPQAFLWNMVALEILLIRQGDKAIEILPERCEALLGASLAWARKGYDAVIRDLVDKRHGFVHRGAMDGIAGDDLQTSDDLLFNVFTNIVKHPKLFPSKDALADFSDDVKAAKRLRGRKRVRPKTMRIWRASRATF